MTGGTERPRHGEEGVSVTCSVPHKLAAIDNELARSVNRARYQSGSKGVDHVRYQACSPH
jgi:hypothetical protein